MRRRPLKRRFVQKVVHRQGDQRRMGAAPDQDHPRRYPEHKNIHDRVRLPHDGIVDYSNPPTLTEFRRMH